MQDDYGNEQQPQAQAKATIAFSLTYHMADGTTKTQEFVGQLEQIDDDQHN